VERRHRDSNKVIPEYKFASIPELSFFLPLLLFLVYWAIKHKTILAQLLELGRIFWGTIITCVFVLYISLNICYWPL